MHRNIGHCNYVLLRSMSLSAERSYVLSLRASLVSENLEKKEITSGVASGLATKEFVFPLTSCLSRVYLQSFPATQVTLTFWPARTLPLQRRYIDGLTEASFPD
jgi:hypothetical protein